MATSSWNLLKKSINQNLEFWLSIWLSIEAKNKNLTTLTENNYFFNDLFQK
jgi:hypothetical protein